MSERNRLPRKDENPEGLHGKYYIQKIDGVKKVGEDFFYEPIFEPILRRVPENAEYFVLRLDNNGKDQTHARACRQAVLHYAELIKDHLPELSKDLIQRYS